MPDPRVFALTAGNRPCNYTAESSYISHGESVNAPASPHPSTPASDSLAGTANALPYEYYERMRAKGEIVCV